MEKENILKTCPFISGIATCNYPGEPSGARVSLSGYKFCSVIGEYKKCDGFPKKKQKRNEHKDKSS